MQPTLLFTAFCLQTEAKGSGKGEKAEVKTMRVSATKVIQRTGRNIIGFHPPPFFFRGIGEYRCKSHSILPKFLIYESPAVEHHSMRFWGDIKSDPLKGQWKRKKTSILPCIQIRNVGMFCSYRLMWQNTKYLRGILVRVLQRHRTHRRLHAWRDLL